MFELWRASFDDKRHAEVDHHHFSWGSMYKAEVSDLVEALQAEGASVVNGKDFLVVVIDNDGLVVPLGEDA